MLHSFANFMQILQNNDINYEILLTLMDSLTINVVNIDLDGILMKSIILELLIAPQIITIIALHVRAHQRPLDAFLYLGTLWDSDCVG